MTKSFLEQFVLARVDDGVDAAVDEHKDNGHVVQQTSEVQVVAETRLNS